MRKWLKNWLFKEDNGDVVEVGRSSYEVLRGQGCIQAFKIDNGYIVRVRSADLYVNDGRVPVLHYCKDHKEIADYIVSKHAMDKLIGEQMELPLTGGYATTAKISANKLSY